MLTRKPGTIDHLLEHAKINYFAYNQSDRRRDSASLDDPLGPSPSTANALKAGKVSLDSDVDLAQLAEEVIETAFEGHNFSSQDNDRTDLDTRGPSAQFENGASEYVLGHLPPRQTAGDPNGSPVKIILDLGLKPESHWVFRTHAGAWRRIILNLTSNALKNTEQGFVKVRLEAVPVPARETDSAYQISLTVTDSGKGMDPAFVKQDLFRPFSKEDPLAPGTGLGMSLVKDIVDKMHGTISVDSAKGKGTEIRIDVPNVIPAGQGKKTLEQAELFAIARKTTGMRVNFFGVDKVHTLPSSDKSRRPRHDWYSFKQSFTELCKDWFGMTVTFSCRPQDADIYVTTAQAAMNSIAKGAGINCWTIDGRPLIVLCNSASSVGEVRDLQMLQTISSFTQYMPQP